MSCAHRRNVDKNSNGAIDFNEFIEMMLRRDSKVEEDVVHAFRELLNFLLSNTNLAAFTFRGMVGGDERATFGTYLLTDLTGRIPHNPSNLSSTSPNTTSSLVRPL